MTTATRPATGPFRGRSVLMAVALALATVTPPGSSLAEEPSSAPSSGLAAASDGTCAVELAPRESACAKPAATPIEPDPAVLDPLATPWERIEVGPDGRSLAIIFWMGVQECYGLHSVEVTPRDGGIDVAVLTGRAPDAGDRFCVALAQEYVTTVMLDEPLIGNVG